MLEIRLQLLKYVILIEVSEVKVGLLVKQLFSDLAMYCLVGTMVKAPASRAADLGSIPAFHVDLFSWSSHTSDLKLATLPGA